MNIDLKNIKLIVSEIDGIITEGLSATDELGNVLFKKYNSNDFEAINEIKKYFKFVFLSKDNAINYNLCRRKNIPFFWAKLSKEKVLSEEILPKYSAEVENVIYIGCSFSDEKPMALSKIAVCPSDAPLALKRLSKCVLNKNGGQGVLTDFYETVVLYNLSTL